MYSNGALFGENEILFIFVVKLKTKENLQRRKDGYFIIEGRLVCNDNRNGDGFCISYSYDFDNESKFDIYAKSY